MFGLQTIRIRDIDESRELDEPMPHREERNRGRYSLGRAIARLATGRGRELDGIEAEVDQELRSRYALEAPKGAEAGLPGFFAPVDVPAFERRALTVSTGAGAIVSPVIPEVIDVLRARTICGRLGARMLDGLHGEPFYPRKTAATSLGWFSESSPAPVGNPIIDQQAKFMPHSTGAYVDITRFAKDFMIPSYRDTVVNDLLVGIGVEVDRVALNGSGGLQPTGLMQTPGIPSMAFGGVPTNALLVGMSQTLIQNN